MPSRRIGLLVLAVALYLVLGLGFHVGWTRALEACRAARQARGEFVEPEVFGGPIGLAFDLTFWPLYGAANLYHDGTPFATPCSHGGKEAALPGFVRIGPARPDDLDALAALWKEEADVHAGLDPAFALVPDAEDRWRARAARLLEATDRLILVAEERGFGPCRSAPLFSYVGMSRVLFSAARSIFI